MQKKLDTDPMSGYSSGAAWTNICLSDREFTANGVLKTCFLVYSNRKRKKNVSNKVFIRIYNYVKLNR